MQIADYIEQTLDRVETRVGDSTTKERKKHLYGARVLRHFHASGLTFDFKRDCIERQNGCHTISQMIAYQMALDSRDRPIINPSVMDRCLAAKSHEKRVRSAIYWCERQIWKDHKRPLFFAPRILGGAKTEVITCIGNYIVNGIDTAAELSLASSSKRDRDRLGKRIEISRAIGKTDEKILQEIGATVRELLARPVIQPTMNFGSPSEPPEII